ncbi:hypothetical protein [Solimicrobium silvestre]|uniref:Uncharacterized protein n=1 Tax=Solimicrobium silvestre TaxID=2099400 RepID=A0A2S9GS75_9BURK|nr:hypothetical protein [Solimicrobium silvestre]PRC90561.1 hypothetical protein S2091_4728 [Solimicrobium silvestre]
MFKSLSNRTKWILCLLLIILYGFGFREFWNVFLFDKLIGYSKEVKSIIFDIVFFIPMLVLILQSTKYTDKNTNENVKKKTVDETYGFKALWIGAMPLSRVFIFLFISTILVIFLGQVLFLNFASNGVGLIIRNSAFYIAIFGLYICSAVGAWRSSKKHIGNKLLPLVFNVGIILSFVLILTGLILSLIGFRIF